MVIRRTHAWMRGALAALGAVCPWVASAQAPDILSALDAGSRALGMGGATSATDITPHAALLNPAGLGYISAPTLTLSFRSLPDSASALTGSLADPRFSTTRRYGRTAFTHLGYAMPLKKGAIGLSYSIGGYLLEERAGSALSLGSGQTAVGYSAFTKSQTDFFTLSYGEAQTSSSYGLGIVVANQSLDTRESYDVYNGLALGGTVSRQAKGISQGIGLVAGWQGSAGADGMVGASVRTPISLKGSQEATDAYGRIPGRASLGYAGRRSIKSGEGDYFTYGLQLDYHFGGEKSGSFARKDALGFGLGLEYSFVRTGSRFPIRLGYQSLEAMGQGLSDRSGFSYGIGWRPDSSRLGLDLNFFKDRSGGASDASLGITYRLSQ